MKNNKYVEFIKTYPFENPKWFANLKYKVTSETDTDYFLGDKKIEKTLEDYIFKVNTIKTPNSIRD